MLFSSSTTTFRILVSITTTTSVSLLLGVAGGYFAYFLRRQSQLRSRFLKSNKQRPRISDSSGACAPGCCCSNKDYGKSSILCSGCKCCFSKANNNDSDGFVCNAYMAPDYGLGCRCYNEKPGSDVEILCPLHSSASTVCESSWVAHHDYSLCRAPYTSSSLNGNCNFSDVLSRYNYYDDRSSEFSQEQAPRSYRNGISTNWRQSENYNPADNSIDTLNPNINSNREVFDTIDHSLSEQPSHHSKNAANNSISEEIMMSVLYHASCVEVESQTVVHNDVACSACHIKPIKGVRYKCSNCQDFNLCQNCESFDLHLRNHIFIQLRVPLPPLISRIPLVMPRLYPGSLYADPDGPSDPADPEIDWPFADIPMHPASEVFFISSPAMFLAPPVSLLPIMKISEVSLGETLPISLVLLLVRITHFDHIEIEALYEQFKALANTRLGINRPTLEWCLGPAYVPSNLVCDRMFHHFDIDGNGHISFFEFVEGLSILSKGTNEEKIRAAFRCYDLDANGRITKNAVYAVLYANFRLSEKIMNDVINFTPGKLVSGEEYGLSMGVEEDLLDELDANRNGDDFLFNSKKTSPSDSGQSIKPDSSFFESLLNFEEQESTTLSQKLKHKPITSFNVDRYGSLLKSVMRSLALQTSLETVDGSFRAMDKNNCGYFEFEDFHRFSLQNDSLLTWIETLGHIF